MVDNNEKSLDPTTNRFYILLQNFNDRPYIYQATPQQLLKGAGKNSTSSLATILNCFCNFEIRTGFREERLGEIELPRERIFLSYNPVSADDDEKFPPLFAIYALPPSVVTLARYI